MSGTTSLAPIDDPRRSPDLLVTNSLLIPCGERDKVSLRRLQRGFVGAFRLARTSSRRSMILFASAPIPVQGRGPWGGVRGTVRFPDLLRRSLMWWRSPSPPPPPPPPPPPVWVGR